MGSQISPDGRFEWDEAKNILNKEDHGIHFNEVRWKGIASYNRRIYFFVSYTERDGRIRIISARLAEKLERELYDENYRQQISGYER